MAGRGGHSGSSRAGEELQGSQAWTEEGKKQRKAAQRPALLPALSAGVSYPWVGSHTHWAGRPGWDGPPLRAMTFTHTKGRSPGATSRTTAGKCRPGDLGQGWGDKVQGLHEGEVRSLEFRALFPHPSHHCPCQSPFPCSPSCPHFPRQHPSSRPLTMLTLQPGQVLGKLGNPNRG